MNSNLLATFYHAHKNAFENWQEGIPVDDWVDKDGNVCIEYISGNWWHYKLENNKVIWW